MSIDVQTIFSHALALPPEMREELAEKLWLSLDSKEQEEVQKAWLEEIESRIDAYEKGEMTSIPLDQAVSSLREKIAKK
jgi:putative addiction module component (TIGR02574 family)